MGAPIERFACVIVGGGPAGLATALFLSHAAPELKSRIVVLEKEQYPREKICAGAVGARADRLLATIGVVVDVPSVPIDALDVHTRSGAVTVRQKGAGRVVRRVEFDAELARLARARGIAIREGVAAREVRIGSDSAVVRTAEGALEADVVVGADGVGSVVRRTVGASPVPRVAQAIEVDTEPVAGDPPPGVLRFDFSRHDVPGYTWDFPTTVDGRSLVCRGVYSLKSYPGAEEGRPDVQDVLSAELARRGLDLARYRKKRFAERGYDRAARASHGRAILVGEALGIDPVSGEGIAQAIQYGAVAGTYVARKLRRGDVDFGDFRTAIWRSPVGRDLLLRSAALPLAYGPGRARTEQFLVSTPAFVRAGLEHFAGKAVSRTAILRSAASAAVNLGRGFFGN